MSEDAVTTKVSQMFENLDVDGNGLISEEEFVQKCQEGEILVCIFVWNNIISSEFSKDDKGNERKCSRASISHQESTKTSSTKTLNKSDLDYLRRKTRFTKHEIKEWFE